MKDLTEVFEHYRECARHLWNVGFLYADWPADVWQVKEQYDEVLGLLFNALVTSPLGHPQTHPARDDDGAAEPFPFFQIIPNGPYVEILVNRTLPASGYWDDPVNEVSTQAADLRLVRYFDFDVLGHREFEYYRVRIVGWPAQPHLIGRDALIRVRQARVLLNEGRAP